VKAFSKHYVASSKMKTFKHYIQEASVTPIKSTPLDLQEVEEIIKKNCSDSLWMFESKTPIWKGEKQQDSILGKNGIAIVDTTKSERKSQNTSNWYTLIIDNNPKYKNYPKRSQSLICTNKIGTARRYGPPMAVIPFNDAKIGIVNAPDIWRKSITMGGEKMSLVHANGYFNMLRKFGLSDTNWQSFIDFDKKLKTDKKFREEVETSVKGNSIESLLDDFVNKVRKVYDNLGFELLTPKQYEKRPTTSRETEMWVGGEVLCISESIFESLCNEFKNENI
jgi:hypothetical protein